MYAAAAMPCWRSTCEATRSKSASESHHSAGAVTQAEKIVRAYREQSAAGVGVFTVDGKMIDIAFIPGAERTLRLARACGMYEGDLV